jgi:hemolysin activation/secretion protein
MQTLTDSMSLYIKGSGQASDKNLDSSEGFGIGGITGVRAYPSGEGYGNIGWVTQTELRYTLNANVAPYAFYDIGSSTANQISINGNTTRNLSGAGVGLRYTQDNWSADVLGSWHITGGKPEDKNIGNATPRLWFSLTYQL